MKKILFHQKKKIFFLLLFLFALPVWLFSAPLALAHTTSGGPAPLLRSHLLTSSRVNVSVLCSGKGCNHKDPYKTRCAESRYPVATAYIDGIGQVELEYSSVCQTNWDEVDGYGGVEYLAGCLARKAGSDGPADYDCYSSTQYSWINTNMLWSPHNLDDAGGCFVELCRGGPSGLISGYATETGYW